MKHVLAIGVVSSAAALVGAQLSFNPANSSFTCPPNAIAFCASDSLKTNIIIRCHNGVGQPGNCNDNLAGIPPVGVKSSALCWQCSHTSGNAACSFKGTVYPEEVQGPGSFTVAQGNALCNKTSSTNSTSPSLGNTTTVSHTSTADVYSTIMLSSNGTSDLAAASPTPAPNSDLDSPNGPSAVVTSSVDIEPPVSHSSVSALTPTNDDDAPLVTDPPSPSVPVAPGSGAYAGAGGPYGFQNASAVMANAAAVASTNADPPSSSLVSFTGNAGKKGVEGSLVVAVGFAVVMLA